MSAVRTVRGGLEGASGVARTVGADIAAVGGKGTRRPPDGTGHGLDVDGEED